MEIKFVFFVHNINVKYVDLHLYSTYNVFLVLHIYPIQISPNLSLILTIRITYDINCFVEVLIFTSDITLDF